VEHLLELHCDGWLHDLPINMKLRQKDLLVCPGKTKGGSITVPLTSCLTVLESAV
jgi:hypothetical protein